MTATRLPPTGVSISAKRYTTHERCGDTCAVPPSAEAEHAAVITFLDAQLAEERSRHPNVADEIQKRIDVIREWSPRVVTPPLSESAAKLLRVEARETRLNVAAKGIERGVHRRTKLATDGGAEASAAASAERIIDRIEARVLVVCKDKKRTRKQILAACKDYLPADVESTIDRLVVKKRLDIDGEHGPAKFTTMPPAPASA